MNVKLCVLKTQASSQQTNPDANTKIRFQPHTASPDADISFGRTTLFYGIALLLHTILQLLGNATTKTLAAMKWKKNVSLLPYNTFGIEARAARFVEYSSVDELREILLSLKKEHPDEPILCVGCGSNLLFTRDYSGTVLHSAMNRFRFNHISEDTTMVYAESGMEWDELVQVCVEKGVYGLENLSHIPGTVGAAAVQNVGAYGVEAGEFIHEVHCLEIATGQSVTFGRDRLRYAYRSSAFKQELKGKYVITQVNFRLSNHFTPRINYGALAKEFCNRKTVEHLTARNLREVITRIRKGKLPEPSEIGSAGSFFMNPFVSTERFAEIEKRFPDIPHYNTPNGDVKIPAAWLIEQCGWKGKSLGRAGVYEKQALVLVNRGGATGSEIVALSEAIRKDVHDKFGIIIQPEAIFI